MNAPWTMLLAEATRKVEPGPPRMDGPDVDAATLKPLAEAAKIVSETLICTGSGQPLYDDGCEEAQARMQWLMAVAQQAALLNQTCPLGHFDRLEIQFPNGRAVAQAREDRLLLRQSP